MSSLSVHHLIAFTGNLSFMSEYFDDVVCTRDLLRKVRCRYQMWVLEDLAKLLGFLLGFACARNLDYNLINEFRSQLRKKYKVEDGSIKEVVRKISINNDCDIPFFFHEFEIFCGCVADIRRTVILSSSDRLLLERKNRFSVVPDQFTVRQDKFWGTYIAGSIRGQPCMELGVSLAAGDDDITVAEQKIYKWLQDTPGHECPD